MDDEIEILKPIKRKTPGKARLNMKSKVAKYFVAHRIEGLSKTEAVKKAGITKNTNITNYERMPTFQALEEKYKDHVLKHIGLSEVAAEHTKNILQDQDKGAKNKAIEMFLKTVEPGQKETGDDEKMIVVLRG